MWLSPSMTPSLGKPLSWRQPDCRHYGSCWRQGVPCNLHTPQKTPPHPYACTIPKHQQIHSHTECWPCLADRVSRSNTSLWQEHLFAKGTAMRYCAYVSALLVWFWWSSQTLWFIHYISTSLGINARKGRGREGVKKTKLGFQSVCYGFTVDVRRTAALARKVQRFSQVNLWTELMKAKLTGCTHTDINLFSTRLLPIQTGFFENSPLTFYFFLWKCVEPVLH